MTSSIRNLVEAGSTNPDRRLITISTKPSASSPRRGRISFQTSGHTAFSRWRFGGFLTSFAGRLNLLLDSAGAGFASLLLHCHISGPGHAACDRAHPAVVCSGRAPPVFLGPSAGAFADFWPVTGPVPHAVRGGGVFGVYH